MPTTFPSSASPFEDDSPGMQEEGSPADDDNVGPELSPNARADAEAKAGETIEVELCPISGPDPEDDEEPTLESLAEAVFPEMEGEDEDTEDEEPDLLALTDRDVPLPGVEDREHALPIRQQDLTRLLLAEPGLTDSERDQLRAFGDILGATFHSEFYETLQRLKNLYAPLDPDSECVHLDEHSLKAEDTSDEGFLEEFGNALTRANYSELDLDMIESAISAPNEKGLTYIPDFSLFEHLKVWVRGYTRITRDRRNARTRFRKRTVQLDAYQRMVIALKFKPGLNLGSDVKTKVLYLRMFKDVPHVDMEMHLPEQGTKVRMRLIDKAQIASPVVMGLPTLAMKALGVAGGLFAGGLSMASLAVMGGLVVAPISAGVNSFFGFHRAKRKHLNEMIHRLYYLTLANNESVLTRLIDSAEDEEYKESLLAYFFLWRAIGAPTPMTVPSLDARIEKYLLEKTGLEINFEVCDALRKLFRLGLASRDRSGGLHAVPIDRALTLLDRKWDQTYRYS